MSYDIDRVDIYRDELTAEDISKVEGLDDIILPCVHTVTWQSTGDFLLTTKTQGCEPVFFRLNQTMLEAINKANIERNPWLFAKK